MRGEHLPTSRERLAVTSISRFDGLGPNGWKPERHHHIVHIVGRGERGGARQG
jgi:hypothetical protein